MNLFSRRSLIASALFVGLLPTAALFAADAPKTVTVDWATYNPVSMLLKDHGWLEQEFAKDGIAIRWVQTLGSNGNPIKAIYVYSKPEWTALVTRKDTSIKTVADLKGKRVAVTRGTDPHIFLVRALQKAGLSEKDIQPVLLQHPDGATALIRGDVDAWAGLDPMMAQAELRDGARLFYRDADANTYGILNVREEFARAHPEIVKRVLAVYETARKYALAHPDELEKSFIAATKLPKDVVEKQLRERTDLSNGKIGKPQRDTILAAGLALQQAGVIKADVDVKGALDALIDDHYVVAAK
jgi:sulfonate transport system substrate-binding protein